MNLRSLQHVIVAAKSLAEGKRIIVFGSASLLASYPELGSPSGPLATTYDADILCEPFDELTSVMLHEALGDNRTYHRIHGSFVLLQHLEDLGRHVAFHGILPAWGAGE